MLLLFVRQLVASYCAACGGALSTALFLNSKVKVTLDIYLIKKNKDFIFFFFPDNIQGRRVAAAQIESDCKSEGCGFDSLSCNELFSFPCSHNEHVVSFDVSRKLGVVWRTQNLNYT